MNPLSGPPPEEVPLPRSPLVRVLAQVKFPLIASIEKREFIAPFQEAIKERYPVLRQEQVQSFAVGANGPVGAQPQVTWRFSDVASQWRVSLSPDFFAIETVSYTSRLDFLSRLDDVAVAVRQVFDPKLVDRVGIRYIDRLVGDAVSNISSLVRPEVGGISGTIFARNSQHSLTESLFTLDEGDQVLARWGLLPAGFAADPLALEAIDEPSWILDLDMFRTTSKAFDVTEIIREAKKFAERIYSVFRWAVTDEFLRTFGGRV